MRNWDELPANAQTVAVVESCIDCLHKNNPYPPNMKIDREAFAACRMGYSAAVYQLEKFMAELTEEIELAGMDAADTNGAKAKRVLEILDGMAAGGEFDGLSDDEKETARQSMGMRLRAEMG